MASTAPQDTNALSVVSKKWDADNKGFLTDEERALRNLDTEGTGTLTAKQLSSFAEQYSALRKENKQIKRGLVGLALLTLLFFIGTVVVASVVAARTSRDTATDPETGVMLASGTNSPVSVNTNEVQLPLAALPFVPSDVAARVKSFSVAGPTEGAKFHRNVGAIDTVDSTSLVITTTTGDKVVWPSSDDGSEGKITIRLADGKEWTQPAACVACAATSVVPTDEILAAVDEFGKRLSARGAAARAAIPPQGTRKPPMMRPTTMVPTTMEAGGVAWSGLPRHRMLIHPPCRAPPYPPPAPPPTPTFVTSDAPTANPTRNVGRGGAATTYRPMWRFRVVDRSVGPTVPSSAGRTACSKRWVSWAPMRTNAT